MEDLDRFKLKFEGDADKYLLDNYKSLKYHFRKLANNSKITDRTRENHYITLMRFGEWCKVPFSKLTKDDLSDYFDYLSDFKRKVKGKDTKYNASTVNYYKAGLKTLLKEIKPELVKCVDIAKCSKVKAPSDMLTQEEIQKLIDCCLNARDRALISTAYESGARRNELLSVQLKHVQFDSNGAIIFIPKSKTFERRVRLVFATAYLKEWLSVHPRKGDSEAPLFCSLRAPYNVISHMGIVDQLKDLQKRAGIKNKKLTMHLFRHTRATDLAKHLTEQQMKTVLGWKPNSSMAAVYVHLSGADVDTAILKMNGIEIKEENKDELKTVRCPRCHELNPASSELCYKCFANLNPAAIAKEIEEKEEMKKQFAEIDKLKAQLANMTADFEIMCQAYEQDMHKSAPEKPKPKFRKIELLPDDGAEDIF